ncbi:MAG: nucleoside phosphorylase [Cyclobacteriaceae bacterium]|nr:nucleoside phosphorylase [Cyclobacteriaceae bacterium]MDH4296997.1 nucleoside phosphorylase [Cyclobacteriaceae bacterium]MDH5249150.1 nucleoside phosphorylase [Cyclobacteriaceae bacterium]
MKETPILHQKCYDEPSVFQPENLLREARRQKGITELGIPKICILDPDGDIEDYVVQNHNAQLNIAWACYHTKLFEFQHKGISVGIIGKAVGASFAVLLAEQLFASGCKLLLSMTSAGQLVQHITPPYFILIEKAVRDEGTSYHYLPAAEFSFIKNELQEKLHGVFDKLNLKVFPGTTWTTDAPYRETQNAIKYYKDKGVHAVEMEASALYAFAQARNKSVICFAHVTNQMASIVGDFEKGEDNGSVDALKVLFQVINRFSLN